MLDQKRRTFSLIFKVKYLILLDRGRNFELKNFRAQTIQNGIMCAILENFYIAR